MKPQKVLFLTLICGGLGSTSLYAVDYFGRDARSMISEQVGIRVSGTVLDKEKNPLPGVNITVVGQADFAGTITDMDGHFYINVESKESELEISYVGFKTQRVKVGNNINFNVILEEDVETLEEVVVTGYGSQKRMSVIGSIETLEPSRLQVGSTRSLSNNLAGQIAGVICGTLAAVLYGMLPTNVFFSQLMWIGISISLLSQYGDLTASFIKRRMGLKDFGRILPGHGGLLDRFDGWIYVLPLIWLVML